MLRLTGTLRHALSEELPQGRSAGAAIVTGIVRPPRLRAGARVALIAPAGPIDEARVERARAMCAALEVEPVLGTSVLARADYLAGSDDARAEDLRTALADDSIDAVWALRGGYGTMRTLVTMGVLPVHQPRAYIGFSDNTAIHLALLRAGIVSFHGPHAGGDFPPFAETCFRRVLFDATPAGVLPLPENAETACLSAGIAEGELIGGNLSLLAALVGTPWAMQARGRIVFIEEIEEPYYRIDRMLMQLRLSGAFDGAAAVIFGQFTDCDPSGCTRPLTEVLHELVEHLSVPVGYGYPFGHVADNWTLPQGVRARFDAQAGTLELLEAAVS